MCIRDSARTWAGIKPELPKIADEKGIIFVCPDGKNSWYWDSPKNPAYRYETFVASELVNYTDKNYSTIPEKKGRAITGSVSYTHLKGRTKECVGYSIG